MVRSRTLGRDLASSRTVLPPSRKMVSDSWMKEMAFRLLGADHNPALYSSRALLAQGLLELWDAYCSASPESCRTCPLARAPLR